MKIYTRTGDEGETGLFAGPRVGKDDPRIAAYGDIDELNAVLGMARTQGLPADVEQRLAAIQHELFAVGGELCCPQPARHGLQFLDEGHVQVLERAMDVWEQELPPLREFILPGGVPAAAALHHARTVCRRAERSLVALVRQAEAPVSAVLLRYLNRLSDLLFVASRVVNHRAGVPDTPWVKPPR